MYPDREFINRQLYKMEQLLEKKKESYRVDMHIHTNCSGDGLQTVEQVIRNAKERKFDIISITDHDSIAAYDEIVKNYSKYGDDIPIIVPGIEFTVSFPAYEGRCHVLKYFYDANDIKLQSLLFQNSQAFISRVEIWFHRIQENKCLQSFFEQYGIVCSIDDYWDFLKERNELIPDYPIIMEYLYSLLGEKGITIWDVYNRAVIYNETDSCVERKIKKTKALKRFYDKYNCQEISHNYRKLRPILAPVGIDDANYEAYESMGSLSVNEYGQIPIQSLIGCGINVMAHPDITKSHCINNLLDCISGLELNCQSKPEEIAKVYSQARELSLFITKGSDKHSNTNEFYEDLCFFDMSYKDLSSFFWKVRKHY